MKQLILAVALLACPAVSAFAQTSGPVNSSQMDAASSANDQKSPTDQGQNAGGAQNTAAIQKIRQDLESAGFTDVKVVAQSFVVQAKSSEGNPVVMTIGPHGMSVFEAMSSGSGTVGSASAGASATSPATRSSSDQNAGAQK